MLLEQQTVSAIRREYPRQRPASAYGKPLSAAVNEELSHISEQIQTEEKQTLRIEDREKLARAVAKSDRLQREQEELGAYKQKWKQKRFSVIMRDGRWSEEESSILVPGDIISKKLGDIIPVDAHLFEGDPLKIDQSELTGESLPVTKGHGDGVYSSATYQQGELETVVIAISVHTFFGKAAPLVDSINQVGYAQEVLTAIGNFCICSIVVDMITEIIVMYPIQDRKYHPGIDNLLVLLIGGIPIAMPTVLPVTMGIRSHQISQQDGSPKTRLAAYKVCWPGSFVTGAPTGSKSRSSPSLAKEFAGRLAEPECLTEKLLDWCPSNSEYSNNKRILPFELQERQIFDYALEGVSFQQLIRMPNVVYASTSDAVEAKAYLALEDFLYAAAKGLWETLWDKDGPMPFLVGSLHSSTSRFYSAEKVITNGKAGGLCAIALLVTNGRHSYGKGDEIPEVALLRFDVASLSSKSDHQSSPSVLGEALFLVVRVLLSRNISKDNFLCGSNFVYVLIVDSQYGGVAKLEGDVCTMEVEVHNVYECVADWTINHSHVMVPFVDQIWNKLDNANWGNIGTLQALHATYHTMMLTTGTPKKTFADLAELHVPRIQKRRNERQLVEIRVNDSISTSAPLLNGSCWTGEQFFIMLRPQHFDYCNDRNGVLISSSELLVCSQDSGWFHNSNSHIISFLPKQGPSVVFDYLFHVQRFFSEWISDDGLSVSLLDMYLSRTAASRIKMTEEVSCGLDDTEYLSSTTHENLQGGNQWWCAGVSHDGQVLMTGGDDGSVSVWQIIRDRDHGQCQLQLKKSLFAHIAKITCLFISQPYTLIVSGSEDSTVLLWDLSGLLFVKLSEFPTPVAVVYVNDLIGDIVTAVGILLDVWSINDWLEANWFISGNQSGATKLWRMVYFSNEMKASSEASGKSVSRNRIMEGNLELSVKYAEYRLVLYKVLKAHKDPLLALRLTSDLKQLLSGDAGGNLLSWTLPDESVRSSATHTPPLMPITPTCLLKLGVILPSIEAQVQNVVFIHRKWCSMDSSLLIPYCLVASGDHKEPCRLKAALNRVHVHIVINLVTASKGSLIHMLRSIKLIRELRSSPWGTVITWTTQNAAQDEQEELPSPYNGSISHLTP